MEVKTRTTKDAKYHEGDRTRILGSFVKLSVLGGY
jgi:hypothetical protein